MALQRPALSVLLIGTLAAFGGAYPWALPFIVGAAGGVWLLGDRPSRQHSADQWPLRLSFGLLVGAVAVQCVPLPAGLRALLTPSAADVEMFLRPDALVRGPSAAVALSLDAGATGRALALLVAAAFTYQAALAVFARGGVRHMTRVLALAGVVIAVAAAVQRAVSPSLIYGFWAAEARGAQPFGPVVNRNHLVAWFVLVSALVAGYLVARLRTRLDGPIVAAPWRYLLRRVQESGAPTMAAAWTMMATAVVLSRSRSGVIGLAVPVLVLWWGGGKRAWHPRMAAVFGLLVAGGLIFVAVVADVPAMADRFLGSFDRMESGRAVIWQETLPLIRDFWLTGTGAGTYGMAMVAYQETLPFAPHLDSRIHFNHAHNHYLHLAAEGGLLLVVPALATMAAFLRLATRRMREERGELLWLRLGAFGGLVALAVLSVWEIPLTMPANALLAVALAAIVTYRRAAER